MLWASLIIALRSRRLNPTVIAVNGLGRRSSLELILPRTRLFQEGVDSLQQWLISVEQGLAELRNAERLMLHLPEATERAKVYTHISLVMMNVMYLKSRGVTRKLIIHRF